ncbi:MAG: TIGR03621 family F420-dependent LLM class oxidoreductase [Acidimicrobiales bacterium]|nr:TIGR03621 family F420-dependent LLM class oxidoreductase [Acidimicrobiales bacterium]
MRHRPFRFAVQQHQSADGPTFIETARRIESLGYDMLHVMDHFGDQLGPLTAMTAAAVATEQLRVGSLVLDNDYRHPLVLAKELATIDLVSDGRLEVGLGAGWMNSDYQESGIPQDRAGIRIDRLEEALVVFKGLWSDEPVTFAGDHYRISAHRGTPKPVQRPHPPILIGGGAPRMLAIAAREADIVGINPSLKAGVMAAGAQDASAESVDRKIELVREAAGDRFDQLELHVMSFAVSVTSKRADRTEQIAQLLSLDPEDLADSPYVLIGSAEEIADDLRRYRERWGISYYTVMGDVAERFGAVVAELAGR